MKETFVNSQKLTTKKWYVIDAEDQILGRLATKASTVLMGKNKNTYTPFLENYLFVINLFSDELTLVKETTLMPTRFIKPSQKLVVSFVFAHLNFGFLART